MIVKNKHSGSSILFTDEGVTKTFPIESGLHYDMAMRIFEYYKILGIDLDYDMIMSDNSKHNGYFITHFPLLEHVPLTYNVDKTYLDRLMSEIIYTHPIPKIEEYKSFFKNDKIYIHARDIKPENLFIYNGKIFLLDIADFYFTIENDINEPIEISDEIMNKLGIKHYSCPYNTKWIIPKFSYVY